MSTKSATESLKPPASPPEGSATHPASGANLEFECSIDFVSPQFLTGWCWFPERPDIAAELRVRAGNAIIATARADLFRKDIAEAGKRGGMCRFDIHLPTFWQTRVRSVHLELADGRLLPNGEIVIPASLVNHPNGPWPLRLMCVDGYLERFGSTIQGWVSPPKGLAPAQISICEGETVLLTIDALDWRSDIEDNFQGDGRGGFDIPVPPILRDGKKHEIDIRLDEKSLLYEPLHVQLDTAADEGEEPALTSPAGPKLGALRKAIADALSPVDFSFVVNFYNMRREAARTLTSLTRAYQRDAENIRYEVICVDNGSNPPLDAAWVESFGPEFRLVRPSRTLPSPCFALNEAAHQAKGRHLAMMIDGAHVLSPGVFREAKAAVDENRDAVVAIRHWFVGGDQRWLNAVGYTREREDILFARALWPSDGYKLFDIGAPMTESPNSWFDSIQESNCLFVPSHIWREIGGFDEAFDEPGGGFCNLDLLRRAWGGKNDLTVLLGEATFHQYHEGTTTNVSDEAKDARVRVYADKYRRLRNEDFTHITPDHFRLRGRIKTNAAHGTRQRPSFNAPLGVTDRIRTGDAERWLDVGLREYLNGSYVEGGLQNLTMWRGQHLFLAPGDLFALHDILRLKRPERIVISAPEPALVSFLDDQAQLLGLDDMRIICVASEEVINPLPRVDYIVGPACAQTTLMQITAKIGLAESVLVLFSPRAEDTFPINEIRIYGGFVSFGSYMVVLRTAIGQPWLGYSKYKLKGAVDRLLEESDFVIDETCTQHVITACPNGFLARVKPPLARADDEALEYLAS